MTPVDEIPAGNFFAVSSKNHKRLATALPKRVPTNQRQLLLNYEYS